MTGETTKIIIYTPRIWTKILHESKLRWKVVVAHRRSGKTVACLNHLIRDAVQNKKTKFAYIAPTYKQSKNVAWDILKEYAGKIDGVKFNESELRADFKNGSRITLYGADNPDSLRGIGLWGVIFDEYSQQPSNIFSEIIRPALADHKGYAIWIGTPKGKNEFHRLYNEGLQKEDWLSLKLTVDDTGLIDPKELEQARNTMSEDEFEQEWYCSFESSIKGAYYARQIGELHRSGRFKVVPYDEQLAVHTVWDLGVGSNLAIGFYQATGNEVRMIDYWEGSNKDGLPQAIKILQERPYLYGKHFAPHDINHTEQGTGKTKLDTAKDLGIDFEVVPSMRVGHGIEQGRLLFNRLWVDTGNCSFWLDAISQYRQRWDEKRGMFIEEPYHDWTNHKADIHRYCSLVWENMTNDFTERSESEFYRKQYNRLKNQDNRYA